VLPLVNRILLGVLATLVLTSAFRNRTDRPLAFLLGWIFLSNTLLGIARFIPRDPATDHAASVLLYWLGDTIIFSWYWGHFIAWTEYRGIRVRRAQAAGLALAAALLLAGALLYRAAQVAPGGRFLGTQVVSPRWDILHSLVIVALLAALYNLARFTAARPVATAHFLLILSTFICVIQAAWTMKLGRLMEIDLYQYGHLAYLLVGIGTYGYRIGAQRLLRPPPGARGGGGDPDLEAGRPA